MASLKWVINNRAYSPWYLVRYWRLLKFKLANPHIITRGMVFLGKGVEIQATPELSTMEIGRWVHIGDKNTIRCHEGRCVSATRWCSAGTTSSTPISISSWATGADGGLGYVCDFDHRMDDINLPIKDQGILKGPVRIGPDTWIATKVTILRNTTIGRGWCSARMRWSRATSRTIRSRWVRRPRSSRTASWRGTRRPPSAPSWPPRWPISSVRKPRANPACLDFPASVRVCYADTPRNCCKCARSRRRGVTRY